mmetsp:Transcript_43764/g.123948  ORF Transcript_43764/g.123948 Transcript_43764/m.123948 type:complete len:206 (+) Transcript_43764:599-1216(+)
MILWRSMCRPSMCSEWWTSSSVPTWRRGRPSQRLTCRGRGVTWPSRDTDTHSPCTVWIAIAIWVRLMPCSPRSTCRRCASGSSVGQSRPAASPSVSGNRSCAFTRRRWMGGSGWISSMPSRATPPCCSSPRWPTAMSSSPSSSRGPSRSRGRPRASTTRCPSPSSCGGKTATHTWATSAGTATCTSRAHRRESPTSSISLHPPPI